jgi:hypothetical protein
VKTSDEGGFTEQLKKLQAEVDAKKLELARREEAMRYRPLVFNFKGTVQRDVFG